MIRGAVLILVGLALLGFSSVFVIDEPE